MDAKIAKILVHTSLRVRADDVVAVETAEHMIPLAKQIAIECYRAGADVLTILDTDEVYAAYMKLLSLASLRTPSKHCLGLGGYTTVNIFMSNLYDPAIFRRIPSEKIAAIGEAEKPHKDLRRERKIRIGGLSLAAVTPQRAKAYGLSYARWKRAVAAASAADYKALAEFGRKLAPQLEVSKHVRITQPAGTNLEFDLIGRAAHIYDGVLDDDDLARGVTSVSIPDGSVGVAPREDSARGTAVFDVDAYQVGRTIRGMRWRFEGGRVVEFTAKANVNAIKPQFDAGHGAKDLLGGLYFGINPAAKVHDLFMDGYLARGAISIQIGANKGLGGTNDSDFGFMGTLSHATLEVDGRILVRNGKFVI